ncbi:dTDP-4-dehydrorhamnose reductase [Bordetella genomosp. 12]|uniref:dTDP-4-dehydrorhamnose reductase n=1 Tax=Bordetella genomosp. 12 TaxID=463035 RepID=A0A261VE89_9BORD|nr:dTDP-4-dehydrorhamnose reductase [Bordetella genomosp. 12]OZI72147.1 dTDP-4-dehydrorhamnose reductase [Bordetella genomosp. 12]
MKILLLGKDGQVGRALRRALAPLGQVQALGRDGGLDLADLDGLQRLVRQAAPDILVNAAAFTAVDLAETQPQQAMRVNAEAPELLARHMRASRGWLVHYSSDYVYDGAGQGERAEDSPAAPLNAYGRSKLAGDQAVHASGAHHLVLRTSWVYGLHGENFPRSVLRLAASAARMRMVDDQIGAPTSADLVADVTALALRQALARPAVGGLYHLAAAGAVSRHAYAQYVIEQARRLGWAVRVPAVQAISTADYPQPAARPLNSRLDCSRLQATFGLRLPDWREGVDRLLADWRASPWRHEA